MKKFICEKCKKLFTVEESYVIEDGLCDKCYIKKLRGEVFKLTSDLEAFKRLYNININCLKQKIISLKSKIFDLTTKNSKLSNLLNKEKTTGLKAGVYESK